MLGLGLGLGLGPGRVFDIEDAIEEARNGPRYHHEEGLAHVDQARETRSELELCKGGRGGAFVQCGCQRGLAGSRVRVPDVIR